LSLSSNGARASRIVNVLVTPMKRSDVLAFARELYSNVPLATRTRQRYRPYICPFEILCEAVPPNSSVLDIGCGEGLFLGILAKSGHVERGVGLDVSSRSVSAAEAMAARAGLSHCISFFSVTGEEDWPDRLFDTVTVVDVIHHVHRRRQLAFLLHCASRVRPGGRLIYKDISPDPFWKASANRLHDLLLAREWVSYIRADQVIAPLRHLGFTLLQQRTVDTLWYRHQLLIFRQEREGAH